MKAAYILIFSSRKKTTTHIIKVYCKIHGSENIENTKIHTKKNIQTKIIEY